MNDSDGVKRAALGSDHSSVDRKKALFDYLCSLGYKETDVGCFRSWRSSEEIES